MRWRPAQRDQINSMLAHLLELARSSSPMCQAPRLPQQHALLCPLPFGQDQLLCDARQRQGRAGCVALFLAHLHACSPALLIMTACFILP